MYTLETDDELRGRLEKKKRLPPKNVIEKILAELKEIAKDCETYKHKSLIGEMKGKFKHKWGGYRAIYSLDHTGKRMIIHEIEARVKVYKHP